MICKKCKSLIKDEYKFCPVCGKSQSPPLRVTTKRANGAGAVTALSGNRTRPWMVETSSFVDKKRMRTIWGYYSTRQEALDALNALPKNCDRQKQNVTLSQMYLQWQTVHFRNIGKSGQEGYMTAWSRLAPYHHEKMRNLKTSHFQEIVDASINAGKSRSTCEKIKQLCSQLCKQAMQDDIINKNYAEFVKLQKVEKKEKEIFTQSDIDILFANDNDETVQIILCLIYTGFRIGEFFSLAVSDIDLSKGYAIGGEKTKAGKNRMVPISAKIRRYIENWHCNGHEFLVTNSEGGRKNIPNFRNREYYPTLDRLGIRRMNPHCTRHTFASLMSNAQVPPDVLQKIIGHADYSTTAEIYIHKDLEQLISAIKRI